MDIVVVRGAGDLATGTILRLHNAGLMVVALDVERPTVIRRNRIVRRSVFEGAVPWKGCVPYGWKRSCGDERHESVSFRSGRSKGETIEGVPSRRPCRCDPRQRNLGTPDHDGSVRRSPWSGLPCRGDCHCVVWETQRGHYLGYDPPGRDCRRKYRHSRHHRRPWSGSGASFSMRRCLYLRPSYRRHGRGGGDRRHGRSSRWEDGDGPAGSCHERRGVGVALLHDGIEVTPGFKVGDVDPRGNREFVHSVSDKARAVAAQVLEAVDGFLRSR